MNQSSAADIIISLVPMLGVIFGSALLFFFLLWRYKLTKEMIRNGSYEPGFFKNLRLLSLLLGSVSISVGLPMTILFFVIEGVSYSVLGGLMPLSAGIGLLLFYGISHKKKG